MSGEGTGTGCLGRPHGASVYLTLKAAVRRLITRSGGLESAASVTRASFQSLSRYGKADDPNFIPVDVIADLEADAGAPIVTRELATLAGYVLLPMAPAGTGDPAWTERIVATAKESSEALSALATAARDGKITPEEVRELRLKEEFRDLIAIASEIHHAFTEIEARDANP